MANYRYWRQFFFAPEKRDFTFLYLSALLIAIFLLFEVGPLASSLFATYNEVRSGQAYESALTQKIGAIDQAKKNYDQIASQLPEIEVAIPTGYSQPKLLNELSLDAGRSGVTITSIFFKEKKTTGRIEAESFSLTVSGGEGQIEEFFRALEKGRLIQFDKIQSARKIGEGREGFLATIEGKAFSIP